MVAFPRSAARRLRLLARKAVAGRPRGPAPPMLVLPADQGITLAVALDEAVVALHVPGTSKLKAPLLLPMSVLDAVEGTEDAVVVVECTSKQAATIRWNERGLPRSQDVVLPDPQARFELPSQPETLVPVPTEFLKALHEAGRHTAREGLRYALHRVQVRGNAGEVIGTDSSFVYRHGGFSLPFKNDLLVPAVPLFGLKEMASEDEVRVGGTAKHLVVVADPITVYLAIDTAGRFPDVASVVPKTPAPATLTLDPKDALFLLDTLPALPGGDDEHRPVTLDLVTGRVGIVRAKAEASKEIVEIRLTRSTVTRGPLRVALDRHYLKRMLVLGCRTIRVATELRPIVAVGGPITLIAMPLHASLTVKPSPHARVLASDSTPTTPRRIDVKTDPSTNGAAENPDLPDPLVEAEALRTALGEAQHRLGRLLTALKSKKKEQRALTQVWSSLKSLNLGG